MLPCSQKRWSSLRTIAASNAGDTSAIGVGLARCRTALSKRERSWIGVPLGVFDERAGLYGRCAASTLRTMKTHRRAVSIANRASAKERLRDAADRSKRSPPHHGATSISGSATRRSFPARTSPPHTKAAARTGPGCSGAPRTRPRACCARHVLLNRRETAPGCAPLTRARRCRCVARPRVAIRESRSSSCRRGSSHDPAPNR